MLQDSVMFDRPVHSCPPNAAFCVGTPLEPDSRLPMPSYEREVAVRQDPTYLPSSDDNNNNEEDTTGKSSFKTQLSNEKACPENDQV